MYIIDQVLLQDVETFYLETGMWLHFSLCNPKEYGVLRKSIYMTYERWCHLRFLPDGQSNSHGSPQKLRQTTTNTQSFYSDTKLHTPTKPTKHFRTSQTLEQPQWRTFLILKRCDHIFLKGKIFHCVQSRNVYIVVVQNVIKIFNTGIFVHFDWSVWNHMNHQTKFDHVKYAFWSFLLNWQVVSRSSCVTLL